MNSVEKVKAVCKERKIPISRLEKDLGYANGYIGQLRKGVFPDNRLVEIAAYLDLEISFFISEEQKEAPIPNVEDERKKEFLLLFNRLSPEEQDREIAYLRERANG